MQHAARYSAAIEVLDVIQSGEVVERALTGWARTHRFAGSKDRAAIRDIVFGVLRQRRMSEVLGGGIKGRNLVIGMLRIEGTDLGAVFGAGGYAPDELSPDEIELAGEPSAADRLNLPSELHDIWHADLGEAAVPVAKLLANRAPLTLRITTKRTTQAKAIEALALDGIVAVASDTCESALLVTQNERRVKTCSAFTEGLVDVQDLSSQEAVHALRVSPSARVLDYCAGGGGKALAIADIYGCSVTAHDVNVGRTVDIPVRAARAGTMIDVVATGALGTTQPFDLVFCDAPCSGAGTWRRNPAAKWELTEAKLREFNALQLTVLSDAARFVKPGGRLVYATCSIFQAENLDVVHGFTAVNPFHIKDSNMRLPDEFGDGFFWASLTKV